jgi:hypothetical protein
MASSDIVIACRWRSGCVGIDVIDVLEEATLRLSKPLIDEQQLMIYCKNN